MEKFMSSMKEVAIPFAFRRQAILVGADNYLLINFKSKYDSDGLFVPHWEHFNVYPLMECAFFQCHLCITGIVVRNSFYNCGIVLTDGALATVKQNRFYNCLIVFMASFSINKLSMPMNDESLIQMNR
jgi:hypothetical protein